MVYILVLGDKYMGVERQGAKINWFTSLALVVMAGTFYRLRNIFGKVSKIQIKELRAKAGLIYEG